MINKIPKHWKIDKRKNSQFLNIGNEDCKYRSNRY